MPPIIGITRCSTVDDYVESVRQAGGEPRVLDAGPVDHTTLAGLDGLLLTGGVDVDPALYDEAPHPSVRVDPTRDAFELEITRLALEADLPVLGICRGLQVMNVACGGTLVQDIPTEIGLPLIHSVTTPKTAVAHTIDVRPDSRLARILNGTPGEPSSIDVNSRHHQAPRRVAPGFSIAATAPDGVIEALERSGARFCVGVQWHPENFCRSGEFARLFDAFVDACRAR